ncbi:MAG: PAS domain-containing protein [Candidatus Aureabacteria bacterium]|nr:PAS domain-containing protein [Candidatus Auribacterota bacterium]
MKRKKLIWHLYPSYLFIILLSLSMVTGYALSAFKHSFLRSTSGSLKDKAILLKQIIQPFLESPVRMDEIDALCKQTGKNISTRITVILPDGMVAGDSEKNPKEMENHLDRPEIRESLQKGTGQSIRFSNTLKKNMMYVAWMAKTDSKIMGFIRMSLPLTELDEVYTRIMFRILLTGFLISLCAGGISFLISRKISQSLERLKEGAERFASGDLHQKIQLSDSIEMSKVAEAMNQMALELEAKIRTIRLQQNELDAIFFSMTESVLALDNEEKVLNLNQTASKLFHIPLDSARGRPVHEIIRNADMERFIKKAFAGTDPVETEIVFREGEECSLQARSSLLKNADGINIGILIVMNDITRLKKLETIRQDFVANVSHELRTPVTSIKGFIETLKNGAMDDAKERDRFLDIIMKQTDRLNAIIEDLLSLSRIEQESQKGAIILEQGDLNKVLDAAIRNCEKKAEDKNIRIIQNEKKGIVLKMNPSLLEQAFTNLIDNAVKYSDPGKEIQIQAVPEEKEVRISVRDWGCGISREHLSRIFERFYRVDKARSRKMGGTGLGLSITKHIVQAHGGGITVESTEGKGSTFTVRLPLKKN